MGAPKKPAGKVEKLIRRVVLGPEEGRGTEPRDARELTDETDSADEQQQGGDRRG